MIVHKTLGSGISGTVRYVMGEGKRDPKTGKLPTREPGAASRVAWFGGTGFGFPIDSKDRLDIARRLMEWAERNQASKTKQCTQDCLHLSLSWDQGENPTRPEMEAAAHAALAWLGMANARAIFAAHSDTEHRHLHLVISRINPENGKAFPDSFDTEHLSAWALAWEQEHGGVRCEARLEKAQRQAERDPDKVVQALMARRETFTPFDLNRDLTGAIPARDLRRAYIGQVLARADIIKLADPDSGQVIRYTTRQTLAAEHLAEASAARLHAGGSHRVSETALAAVLDRSRAEGKALRADQLAVLRHVTGAEGLAIVSGKAGTGKSYTMVSIAAAYAAEGYAVEALAPTNKVASALKRDGLDAGTIHSALGALDRGKTAWNNRTVVMVDESGMISTRLMARLLSHAEQAGAKVILLGDEKQLASMQRGGLFGYLAELHGAGELNEITRQRGAEQRQLALRASVYDFKAALTGLDAQGGVVTVDSADERITKAVELWGARSAEAPGQSLFVVTASNADAEAANRAIREIRRARGELGADHILPTADGPRAFAQGDRILFSGSAASRESRAAGLVNGNAGTITRIEGDRVSVALDGARPGETVTFTVGKDRAAGQFDAIRHGLAGTIYKAQGATYDEVMVIDSPAMRASAAYVALTRHRERVSVVTARDLRPGFESWMQSAGGLDALAPAQRDSAERSFEKWRTATNPGAARRHDLADYVAYVQAREAERRAQDNEQGRAVADLAKRWSRVEDRRAASRFEARDYQAPAARRLTPAEVRAAVGVETFEQDPPRREPARGPVRVDATVMTMAAAGAAPAEDMNMDQGVPSDEELLRQADLEAGRLRELQQQEERAQAFRRARQIEAEEARNKQAEHKREAEAHDGDISSASARYAIALGETYSIRDPYASLARAAMSEYAMFHRTQEKLREDMANERDPDKKRVIELRRTIEACDYMALTSERLAGISVAIVGREDAPQAVTDRERAVDYRARAAALRAERTELVEAILHRVEVTADDRASVAPAGAPAGAARKQPETTQGQTPPSADAEDIRAGVATMTPRPEVQPAEATEAAAAPSPREPLPEVASSEEEANSTLEPATVNLALNRADVIARPPATQVTRAKSAPETPPEIMPHVPPEQRQLELPWMEALRRRVEEAAPAPGDKSSEHVLARLERRLQQGKSAPEAAKGQARDDPGPEPDM